MLIIMSSSLTFINLFPNYFVALKVVQGNKRTNHHEWNQNVSFLTARFQLSADKTDPKSKPLVALDFLMNVTFRE